MKKCTKCGKIKNLSEFSLTRGKPVSHCKSCKAETASAYREKRLKEDPEAFRKYVRESVRNHRRKNPETYKILQSQYRRKYLYGLTQEQINILGENQNWKCGGCSCDISDKPYLDHDHNTGEIRGLLCIRCNLGLGLLKDSPNILLGLINYLKHYQKRRK